MRTSKDIGLAHNKHSEKCNCGEAVFRRLPTIVCEQLTCQCQKDYREHRERFNKIGLIKGGYFCTLCGKPERFSVTYYIFNCEACDKFFTYDYRTFPTLDVIINFPPPNILCKDCDVPAPTRRRRIRFD